MKAPLFIHLKARTDYSLLKSSIKIDHLIDLCIANRAPAVGVMDYDNLFGLLEFAEEAVKRGVQPIIGCNIYCYSAYGSGYITLIAKNDQGYHNLLKLVSIAHLQKVERLSMLNVEGKEIAKDQAFITQENLEEYSNGLICLLGEADRGLLPCALTANEATGLLEFFLKTFPEHLYIELQRHGYPAELALEKELINCSYHYNIPLVATHSILFAESGDYEAHDALTCIAESSYISEEGRRKYSKEHYFKSPGQMAVLFSDLPEAIANTVNIAKRCTALPKARSMILPKFSGGDEATELITQAKKGLQFRLNDNVTLEYQERLDFELKVINSMQYAGYFLIVADFVNWAKRNKVPVGPGRGSGAGSLVAWSLKITELDPIRFGLIFERFLNPERISMPDFDIDICQEKRDQVINYVQARYGHVAQIITFGKLQARAVLRDVGRVFGIPYSKVDSICKMVPQNAVNPISLKEAIDLDPKLKKEGASDESIHKLLSIGLKLEGLYRHPSTHAAGIVISDAPIDDIIPLYYDAASSLPITQYSMKYVEKSGLIKFDFLGLKTLTLIDKVCDSIRQSGREIDISSIPLNDLGTYKMLATGRAIGVFQLESSGMREVLQKLKPDSIEDIIALISLYRPGPMGNIDIYIKCKHKESTPDYLHPLLAGILQETFGVIVYQEQVIKIAQVMSGYSLGHADLLRRAMGKKIKQEMEQQAENFVAGAIKNNVDSAKARYIFELVAKFAGYGFNKSHAAAYALIAYQTAYLKTYYPKEFFAALFNLDIDDTDKLFVFIYAAKEEGIKIVPPDINYSDTYFTVKEDAILYGLGAIKNVGVQAMSSLLPFRPFSSVSDFVARINLKGKIVNKKILENLGKSGAFDSIGGNRKQISDSASELVNYADYRSKSTNQLNLFDDCLESSLDTEDDWGESEEIKAQAEALGFYLDKHPLDQYQGILKKLVLPSSVLIGIVAAVRIRSSPRGKFAIILLSAPSKVYELTLYQINEEHEERLSVGKEVVVILESGSDMRRIGKGVFGFEDYIMKSVKSLHLAINENFNLSHCRKLLTQTEPGRGDIEVYLSFSFTSSVLAQAMIMSNAQLTVLALNELICLEGVLDYKIN